MYKQPRQGDVLLERVEALPADAKKIEGKVLAHGETTGHMHAVKTAELFRGQSVKVAGQEAVFVVVPEEGDFLTHQKHADVELLPGVYEYTHQREMDYFAGVSREVDD
jgi:hypothetical protein